MLKYIPIFIFLLSGAAAIAEEYDAGYGKWESYSEEHALKYPDFSLYYKGKTEGAFYPGQSTRRMGANYNFVAQNNEHEVEVSWSSGTGVIDPVFF